VVEQRWRCRQLELTWSESYTIDKVVLYDRPDGVDQITSGTLTFSDGTVIDFGALPTVCTVGLTVTFPAIATTSLTMTVTSVSSTTINVGLQSSRPGASLLLQVTRARPRTL
jgi:hypothetical protein